MERILTLKVGISGVRGVVGESLTPQLAGRFASAFGTYLGPGRIVVGRDARPSGPLFREAVLSGLLAVGCQPVYIGVAPIPTILVFTKTSLALGGLAVTASHNPPPWNGMKFLGPEGLYLSDFQVEEFLDIYRQGEFAFVPAERHKAVLTDPDAGRVHLERLLRGLNLKLIRKRKFRVVADCSNGAGAVLLPDFLKALGCRAKFLNAAPDGIPSRRPEPAGQSLSKLRRTIRDEKADIGFIQDSDADRLAVLDEKGRPLGEEMTLALAVKYILERRPGPVVVNLSTTRAIDDLAARAGVPVIRTKIGEVNVVREILARKAAIGGEGNGGVIWPRVHPCRDSFAAIGLLLEMMAASRKPVSSLRREIPFYAMVKDKIAGSPEEAHRVLAVLRKKYAASVVSVLDGLRMDFPSGWVHLRPSNTEPVIRILAEAGTEAAAKDLALRFKKEAGSFLAGRRS